MEDWNEIAEDLAALRVRDATPARVERIRSRCLAGLEARRRSLERRKASRARLLALRIEPAIAFGVSALYLAEVLQRWWSCRH